jgi:hypothetical protein
VTRFRAIVLAGERPGGNALAQRLGLPAGVLAPLLGRSCLARVLDALQQAATVDDALVCGPAESVLDACADLRGLLAGHGVAWMAPASGPAASALAAAEKLDGRPLHHTSGDHGLLNADNVEAVCRDAEAPTDADFVVGLVPHERVVSAYPHSRRTVLRFADGAYCGSNLYAVFTADGRRALGFWQAVEAQRKRPWKIARHLGALTLLRYVTGRLSVRQAFDRLSRLAGCRVAWVEVSAARAAVDVDSEADWRLAEQILASDGTARP